MMLLAVRADRILTAEIVNAVFALINWIAALTG
jgi:hypothetical protein